MGGRSTSSSGICHSEASLFAQRPPLYFSGAYFSSKLFRCPVRMYHSSKLLFGSTVDLAFGSTVVPHGRSEAHAWALLFPHSRNVIFDKNGKCSIAKSWLFTVQGTPKHSSHVSPRRTRAHHHQGRQVASAQLGHQCKDPYTQP